MWYEPLAFGADERRNDVAELACRRFAILLHVLLAFSAYSCCAAPTAPRIREYKIKRLTCVMGHQNRLHICMPCVSSSLHLAMIAAEINKKQVRYLVCWNSVRQYVHLTIGNVPRHSWK